MQPQTDTAAQSYYHQYYQNPTSADPPPFNPISAAPHASAPPELFSPADYYSFPSNYPSNPDQYTFPHLHETSHDHNLPYHQNQSPVNYDYAIPANPNPNPNPNPSPNLEPRYDPQYSLNSYHHGASALPYDSNSFETNGNYGEYQGRVDVDAGVYKYNGGKIESSYGGKEGRSSDSGSGSSGVMFDDYGRPINVPGGKTHSGFANSVPKIVKAVPKAEDSEDVRSGIQKFRVKLLSEGFDQGDMDVLCQIGLDGIRILDPITSRTLKIYPLDTVTRWEVLDMYIFAFWAKTNVDPEPARIRLKSTSYTTNNILDTVTAASIQSKEIGPSSSDLIKGTDQSLEKKKAFIDWKNLIKPINEEKDHWVPDEAVTKCKACISDFNAFNRKHHCRNCGDIFCDKCTQGRITLTADEDAQPVRVCDQCMAEVTQRLSNKVAPGRVAGLQSHEDLAKRLQEEMDKKRKTGVKAEASASRTRMREVACPTCTVHLQVQVPASGSETIECSVCQHPFLVNAH